MPMNEVDIWLWETLKMGHNPMFTIAELCRKQGGGYWADSHHPWYRKIQYSMNKFEKFGLLYVYRVTNGGTVFMSKVRAI